MGFGLTTFLMIALGGGLGSSARAALSGLVSRHAHPAWGTFVVNVSGGFLIGVGYALHTAQGGDIGRGAAPEWEVFALGLLGGYTTVSSFALQTEELWRAGAHRAALANALGSLAACPLAAALGVLMVRMAGG